MDDIQQLFVIITKQAYADGSNPIVIFDNLCNSITGLDKLEGEFINCWYKRRAEFQWEIPRELIDKHVSTRHRNNWS